MTARVAIVGGPDQAEVRRLALRLEERGAEALVLDARRDPTITIEPGRECACGVDLACIRAVYVADLRLPPSVIRTEDGLVDPAASRTALARSQRQLVLWNTLLARLAARARVVNPPSAHDLPALKPWEAFTSRGADLPFPETLATTDPDAVAALDPGARRAWIPKGLVGGYGYTEPFEPWDAAQRSSARGRGALLVQERIEGDNCRAFVVGGRVVASALIISTSGDETDSRRGDRRFRRIELPPAAERTAIRAAATWGMGFAAVDFMREARGGDFLLLECNSAPFFVVFEAATGCDVSGRLADHLLSREPR